MTDEEREQVLREALGELTDEDWAYLAIQGGKHPNGIWRSDVEQMIQNRLARLLPRPQTLQERVEAILDVHGLHHISDAGNKIVAAEIVALLEARK